MTKTERLYSALLPLKVVDTDDIVESAKNIIGRDVDRDYVYRKYIHRLVDKGKFQRVRRGLYVVLSPMEQVEGNVPDRFLIASKIRDKYFLGFHTALEFYGCAHSMYNEVYVCVRAKERFDPFKYQGVKYTPVFVEDVNAGVVEKRYDRKTLLISSKEKTFIDCIDRVRYTGGWEECLKSLEGLNGLDFEELVKLLKGYDKDILYRRVGYVLELLKDRSIFYEHLDDRTLKIIEDNIKETPRYLIRKKTGPLNSRWNLYIPDDFDDIIRGI